MRAHISIHFESAEDVERNVKPSAFVQPLSGMNASVTLDGTAAQLVFFPNSAAIEAFIAKLDTLRDRVREMETAGAPCS